MHIITFTYSIFNCKIHLITYNTWNDSHWCVRKSSFPFALRAKRMSHSMDIIILLFRRMDFRGGSWSAWKWFTWKLKVNQSLNTTFICELLMWIWWFHFDNVPITQAHNIEYKISFSSIYICFQHLKPFLTLKDQIIDIWIKCYFCLSFNIQIKIISRTSHLISH